MGIIDNALTAVITNSAPARDVFADRLAWVNDSPENDLDDYPGPGWDAEGYVPSPEEAAEVLGWEVGLSGEGEPFRCDDFSISTEELFAARMGWVRGRHERDERAWREELEYNLWLEDMAREREAELMLEDARGWHEAERVSAVGSIKARGFIELQGGGWA